jgi:hypothetical protein
MMGPEIGLLIVLFWAWWVLWWPAKAGGSLPLAMEGAGQGFPLPLCGGAARGDRWLSIGGRQLW